MKNLLPIGSVVTLTDATKKIMIIGTDVKLEDDDTIYNYVGVPFPEGNIGSDVLFLFQNDDIENVDFVGFVNSEVQIYRTQTENEE